MSALRRWPGFDGFAVIGCAVVVIVAAIVRQAEVWNWIAFVLAIDAVYLGSTLALRTR